METALTAAHRVRLATVRAREDDAFRQRVPRSLALGASARDRMPNGVPMAWMAGLFRTPPLWLTGGQGARSTDVDGNSYLDFNVCDMSAVLAYRHPRLVEAAAEQAARGVQLIMPVETALTVCDELRLRFSLSRWQFTSRRRSGPTVITAFSPSRSAWSRRPRASG